MHMPSKLALSAAVCLAVCACQSTPASRQSQPPAREFEVIALEHAESGSMSKTLSGLFTGSTLRVQPETRTNSLLLGGSPTEMANARGIVAELDVEVTSDELQASVEVILLENARAKDVRSTIRGLVNDRTSEIALDERRNALLVSATPASMALIKELVVELDRKQ